MKIPERCLCCGRFIPGGSIAKEKYYCSKKCEERNEGLIQLGQLLDIDDAEKRAEAADGHR